MAKKQFHLYLPETLDKWLSAKSNEQGISKTALILTMLNKLMKDEQSTA
ncbi:hypothetical protein AGMMS49975_24580 [Clostridia bacterium]|nr:hypothetical protein AGMMS49975_24580 [Clostridia bacterium]